VQSASIFLKSPLLAEAGFAHGFTTRTTDVRAMGNLLGFTPETMFVAKQVHGARVVRAGGNRAATAEEEGDALVAFRGTSPLLGPLAVAIKVADCVPVLLGDEASGAVAAAHAGWRGVVAGVVSAALYNLRASDRVVAAIGPCIGACCFEVGRDVASQISEAAGTDVVTRTAGEKAFVDLRRAVRAQLASRGVHRVDDVPGCTKCEPERFFSYRRDGAGGGRLLGVICVR
jgi:hypothetical protein